MSGIDNRIVTMQFNNRDFETNARTSLTTLQKLKESMNFGSIASGTMRGLGSIGSALGKFGRMTPFAPLISGAQKGFSLIGGVIDKLGIKNPFRSGVQGASDLQRAAQAAAGPGGMGMLEGGVTAVSGKFVALSTIAITALSNITNRAINAGSTFLKSFSVGPIMDGLHEYETNLQAIQTVQANTDQPLSKINKSLDELNKYSDQTIYNFGEMARNVGTFTAAGVNLETSVSSIKGIANLAALSGSTSQQAATAMYQLSQAIASGRVGLMDWNSVVNAGMGGKKLQNALAQTAVAMGKIEPSDTSIDKMGKLTVKGESFRESIMAKPGQESWLDSDILVNTLAVMDGRFSKAALGAEKTATGLDKYTAAQIQAKIATARTALEQKNGVKYSDEQFAALQHMSDQAFEAAQKVKTLGQVFDIAKETIGSGWSASFRNIFGNLNQAKELFTGMSNGLNDIINQNARARNLLLVAWAKGGGRTAVIDGLKNAWQALLGLLGPIREGFRDIFPAKTSKDLIDMSKNFRDFMARLIPGKKTMADIRDIAGGVFAVFSIGKTILGGVVTMFKTIFSAIGGGNGDFLSFAGSVGDMVKGFDDFLKSSGVVTAFFQGLGGILAVPLSIIKGFGAVLSGIFGGFDAGAANKIGDAVDGIGSRLSGLQAIGQRIRDFFVNIGEFFGGLGAWIGKSLVGVGDMIAGAFTPETFGSTLDVINTTLLGGLVLLIRNFFSKGVNIDLTGGLFDGIKQTLGEATSAFTTMQNNLKADILLKLAFAIGVMALSLLVLSGIDPGALTKALAAMSGGFGVLIGAMATLLKVMGPAGLVQLYVITSAMTKMALSILLLAFALKIMAGIKLADMIKGLLGLGIMMKILSKTMPVLAAGSKGMAKASSSLILVGIAMNILAVALKIMASMSWEEMARGLITLASALVIIGLAMRTMPKSMLLQSVALNAVASSMILLGFALKVFGSMSLAEIAKGLFTLAGSMVIIGMAIRTMPKTMLLQAVALNAVASALVILSAALKVMGSMSWEQIAKGMVVLAGSMIILAVGLRAIGLVGTVGAVGLLAAASALAIFAPVMLALGAMKWESIIKSLTMLAGIFVILGVAGYLLAPLVPVILGLGAALLLMGAGLALAGAGALAAATAFAMVVAAGAAGIQILIGLLGAIIAAIPPALAAFGRGIVGFAVEIGKGAPRIALAMARIMNSMLNQVLKAIPKIGRVMLALVNMAINVVMKSAPRLANAGLKMINALLKAAANNVGRIVDSATKLVVNFLNALSRNLPKIIQAGVRFIISFVNGVANAIRNNKDAMGRAGLNLASALIGGVTSGLRGGAGLIRDAAVNAAKAAFQAAKDFFKIKSPSKLMRDEVGYRLPQGMALGVKDGEPLVVREISTLGSVAMDKMSEAMQGVSEAFALDPNLNPTISPVLDLAALTKEANKMSAILATAPIMPTISYQTAADISAMTNSPDDGGYGGSGGGDQYVSLEQHLHSPRPIDSVEAYRGGKTLISLAKEALK